MVTRSSAPKLADIAARINTHLKRFAAEPMTAKNADGRTRFWSPSAVANGRYVSIVYISYQHHSNVPKAEALAYLARLDGGWIGTHHALARELAAKDAS